MEILIETERLIIRELLPSDDEGMFELDADPNVLRYVGRKPIHTIEEARGVIQFIRNQYATDRIGRWAVLEKGTGDFLGWTGFKLMHEPMNNHVNHYDFGYRFIQRCWGKGFATEAGKASLEYGVKELGLAPVYAATDVDNAASRRILEKLGFRFVEIFKYDTDPGWRTDDDLSATWYELS
jgi:ribosomal-protein-alanine N-acetyltransferase